MSQSFYEGPPWRFVVADLDCVTITFLDRLARNRSLLYTLNKPWQALGVVPSDDREVNITQAGDPFVAQSDRLLFGFRREDSFQDWYGVPHQINQTPWVVRFSGILMSLEDEATTDQPSSHLTAYDPWQYLYSRPVLNALGVSPGEDGLPFNEQPAEAVVLALLQNASEGPDGACFIDYGQTPFYQGTIESCDPITLSIARESSVGEAWDQVVAQQKCDIVLIPIYDPVGRPGLIAELNVFQRAGVDNPAAIFSWDRAGRSLVDIDRQLDGTQLANKVLFSTGLGGPAVTPISDATSVAKYGPYWTQFSVPDNTIAAAVQLQAATALDLRKNGVQSITVSPTPEFAPIPFEEYFLGDRVPLYTSNNLRLAVTPDQITEDGFLRVYSIPIILSDDALEQVQGCLLTPGTL